MTSIKHQLFEQCQEYVSSCLNTIRQALTDAQQAAHEETKSSAGDKYETTRAMMDIEAEKNRGQLANLEKLGDVLRRIDPQTSSAVIELGSLVITDLGNFYISVSAGKLSVEGTLYYAISTVSPLGSKLMGRAAGDAVQIEKRTYTIKDVM